MSWLQTCSSICLSISPPPRRHLPMTMTMSWLLIPLTIQIEWLTFPHQQKERVADRIKLIANSLVNLLVDSSTPPIRHLSMSWLSISLTIQMEQWLIFPHHSRRRRGGVYERNSLVECLCINELYLFYHPSLSLLLGSSCPILLCKAMKSPGGNGREKGLRKPNESGGKLNSSCT